MEHIGSSEKRLIEVIKVHDSKENEMSEVYYEVNFVKVLEFFKSNGKEETIDFIRNEFASVGYKFVKNDVVENILKWSGCNG